MPGTRTAPAVTGAKTGTLSTLYLGDASGDITTVAIVTPGATSPTFAALEAYAAQYQLFSNASLYGVSQESQWMSDFTPSNALALYRASIKDGINVAYKNFATFKTQAPRLIAPIEDCFDGDLDTVLLTPMSDFLVAQIAMLTGYTFQHAQYTERRERRNNPRVK